MERSLQMRMLRKFVRGLRAALALERSKRDVHKIGE